MEFTDKRLPALYAQRREIAEKISEIEGAEIIPLTAGFLGRCYRFRNNYSCPKNKSDYWFLYAKVTGVDGRSLTLFQFQRDKDGRSSVEPDNSRFWGMEGYEEISHHEFHKQWVSFCAKMTLDFPIDSESD